MKKLLCVLIAVTLISALFLIPASAETNVVSIEFKGDSIKPLASDDPAQLYDGAILSEADATACDFNKAGILLIQNTTCTSGTPAECTIVFELDSVQSIDTVSLYWFCHGNSMIGLPTDGALIVGTSVDGNGFTEDAYEMDSTIEDITASFQRATIIDLGAPVDAKYVSVSFNMGLHGYTGGDWDTKVCWEWVGLTEVGASLKSAGDENSFTETSQEESVDLDSIEPIVEIPEGAKYIKHVPFNKSIVTDSNTIITDPTNLAAFNVAWASCALLRPTEVEGEYSVVAVKSADGNYEFTFGDAVAEGDIAFAVHGESTEAAANSEALAALVEGDIVTFAGYNFEEQTFETGAVVYYAVPAEIPDVSEPEDESSEPADESSEPADESSEPADEDSSAPAVSEDDQTEEKDGNPGLIIGIVVAVVVVAAIVVVVVVAKKKK